MYSGNSKFLSLQRVGAFESMPKPVVEWLETVCNFKKLNTLMDSLEPDAMTALRALQEECGSFAITGLENVPTSGCNVLVANHPLGGADIVAAIMVLEKLDRPYRIISSKAISAPVAFSDTVIPVDVYGDSLANVKPLKKVMSGWGHEFDNLFIFPSGRCSRFKPTSLRVSDNRWGTSFVRMAESRSACVCPVRFSGRNSVAFYAIALLFGDLAGLRLPSEFFKKRTGNLVCELREVFRDRYLHESLDEYAQQIRLSLEGA